MLLDKTSIIILYAILLLFIRIIRIKFKLLFMYILQNTVSTYFIYYITTNEITILN